MVQKKGFEINKDQIVNINGISKSYNNKDILKNINLVFPKNKITAIIGPNGAGKTSLIRIIVKLIKPNTGDIKIYSKKIATVLENDFLYPNKTGIENINSFRYYFKYNKKNLDYYLDILDLKKHLNKKVQYYSKGMKRKLSILITLLREADFIILDEPTSGIDPESRVQIRNLLIELKSQNKSVFISTHDLAEIEKCCDHIIILNEGKIIKIFDNSKGLNLENEFFKALEEQNV